MSAPAERAFRVTEALSDETIAAARADIGREIRTEGWNRQASQDSIRHYAWGLGDDNPLFCDLAYGRSTRHGSVVAPPTFLYTISDTAICPGLPGVQPIYGGTSWEFERPVRLDEVITARAVLVDVLERRGGRRAPRFLVQRAETVYRDAEGRPVARAVSDTLRIPRAGTADGLRYVTRGEHAYSEADLAEIERDVRSEVRRGGETRHFEDVAVGETVQPVVKGPINQFTMTAYYAGCVGSPGYKSAEMAWKYRRLAREAPDLLPDQYDPSYFAEYVSPSLGHQNIAVAHEIGMPGAYNNGPQRVGWAAHLLTNWCGDDGFVRSLAVRLREAEVFGDTIRIGGRVTGKREIDGAVGAVDIAIRAENQLGVVTAEGSAAVELPRR